MPISTIKNAGLEGPVSIAKGGTGATDSATALSNLGAQPALVSGTNIKTVNGSSLLGSGDLAGIATTGSNIYTATQELATGAAIASAATINLNTATGNRVHITGTTTITAVTLTRGPRTVIFDGVLTLTHHATNNNLPGEANITTAAGDRAIYESDGTTVYCVAYTRKNGSGVAAGAGDHYVAVHTGNGHGSTNAQIRRFTTLLGSAGTAITYSDSATLGATFTVNESGLYSIYYGDCSTTGDSEYGISRNSAQLTTGITSITESTRLGIARSGASQVVTPVSVVARLGIGDVIRAHTSGNPNGTASWHTNFVIRKIGSW